MKYLLMIYGNEEPRGARSPTRSSSGWSPRPTRCRPSSRPPASSSAPTASATRCWPRRSRWSTATPVVTDGPYLETKEYLGSFDIIDVDSLERALEIAARVPFAADRLGRGASADARGAEQRRERTSRRPEDLLRELAPQVLGALVRRYGHFDAAEDAVQEALLAASVQWPEQGRPDNPAAWLIDGRGAPDDRRLRGDEARRRRGGHARRRGARTSRRRPVAAVPARDDTLTLLFLCCHPALSAPSQLALTLRAVGGLTTAEIAAAFLVPEATMAQRISRAKQSIKTAGADLPPPARRRAPTPARGSCSTSCTWCSTRGTRRRRATICARTDLTAEAIRLTRRLHRLLPDDGEVAGLLALMLLTDARRTERTAPTARSCRSTSRTGARWDQRADRGGRRARVTRRCSSRLRSARTSCRLRSPPCTTRRRARGHRLARDPRALRAARPHRPQPDGDAQPRDRGRRGARTRGRARAARRHSTPTTASSATTASSPCVRHLLELAGDVDAARHEYRRAARSTTSRPEQRHLEGRARMPEAASPQLTPSTAPHEVRRSQDGARCDGRRRLLRSSSPRARPATRAAPSPRTSAVAGRRHRRAQRRGRRRQLPRRRRRRRPGGTRGAGRRHRCRPSTVPRRVPSSTVGVTDADGLAAALDAAAAGRRHRPRTGHVRGQVRRHGRRRDRPIWLCGPRDAVIDGGGIKQGYALHLDGAAAGASSGSPCATRRRA